MADTIKTEFVTLGTAGGPVPNRFRCPPSHAIMRADTTILVDCGEGAFRQLKRAGVDFRACHDIILTHHHFDHIGSLFAGLGQNMMLQRSKPLNIYGPPGTAEIVEHLIAACRVPHAIGFGVPGQTLPHPSQFTRVHEITADSVLDLHGIKVSFCENTHFRGEGEHGTEGPLSLSVRFDAPDRTMVFTGDTGPSPAVENFARGAELLVGEMIDVEGVMARVRHFNPDMSAERIDMIESHMALHHLNPEQLGQMATAAGVDHVVAVHLPLENIRPENAHEHIAQVAAAFSGKISIAEDLERF